MEAAIEATLQVLEVVTVREVRVQVAVEALVRLPHLQDVEDKV